MGCIDLIKVPDEVGVYKVYISKFSESIANKVRRVVERFNLLYILFRRPRRWKETFLTPKKDVSQPLARETVSLPTPKVREAAVPTKSVPIRTIPPRFSGEVGIVPERLPYLRTIFDNWDKKPREVTPRSDIPDEVVVLLGGNPRDVIRPGVYQLLKRVRLSHQVLLDDIPGHRLGKLTATENFISIAIRGLIPRLEHRYDKAMIVQDNPGRKTNPLPDKAGKAPSKTGKRR